MDMITQASVRGKRSWRYAYLCGWGLRVDRDHKYLISPPGENSPEGASRWAIISAAELAGGRAKVRTAILKGCSVYVASDDLDILLGQSRRWMTSDGIIPELIRVAWATKKEDEQREIHKELKAQRDDDDARRGGK